MAAVVSLWIEDAALEHSAFSLEHAVVSLWIEEAAKLSEFSASNLQQLYFFSLDKKRL